MALKIYGSSRTELINPTVELVSYSTDAVGTIASMWIGTRYNDTIESRILQDIYDIDFGPLPSEYVQVFEKLREMYPEYSELSGREIIRNIVSMVDDINLPPLDAVNFTFMINDASIAFREQLVRSRMPQNFWVQSSRPADMTTMDVNMLGTIELIGGEEAVDIYRDTVDTVRNAYKRLSELGIPQEDIRLSPSSMTHRVFWMVPYRSLKSVMRTRSSWLTQSVFWEPVISGVLESIRSVESLRIFSNSLGVPAEITLDNGRITAYRNDVENEARMEGRDPIPPDPLWIAYRESIGRPVHYNETTNIVKYLDMKKAYCRIWSDDLLSILGWDRSGEKVGPYDPEELR